MDIQNLSVGEDGILEYDLVCTIDVYPQITAEHIEINFEIK